MPNNANSPNNANTVLIRRLSENSRLSREDIAALREISIAPRLFNAGEDIVLQGDKPKYSVVVVHGMVGRYQQLPDGRRQYISFHIAGDMPDLQALFLQTMDHAVSAMDDALVGLIPHQALFRCMRARTNLALVLWRETLLDAAIVRNAVVNNCGLPALARLAHFFCEQYSRARYAKLAEEGRCSLPLVQRQIGEALGMSLIHVSRTLRQLRRTGAMDFDNGVLTVRDWPLLTKIGEFDPAYLHQGAASDEESHRP